LKAPSLDEKNKKNGNQDRQTQFGALEAFIGQAFIPCKSDSQKAISSEPQHSRRAGENDLQAPQGNQH
jgi:hypothetical protein